MLPQELQKQGVAYLDGQGVDGNLLGADLNCLMCYLDFCMDHWYSTKSQASLPAYVRKR
jgi:hypothetical protein